MKSQKYISLYGRLRNEPLWSLLAATNAPVYIALLQTHLYEGGTSVPASVFYERIHSDLEELRAQGANLPQSARAYVADWLLDGYIERRLPLGASEEVYELSLAATSAIRFVASIAAPRKAATESRLTGVIQQLVRLADETDPNPRTRLARLEAEQERINREIEDIRQGRFALLKDDRALERILEIIAQADEITGDFRRVRDEFEQLNRNLRQQLLDHEGSRGDILDSVFIGVDSIADSEAGRTFKAFWRLLNDPEQSASFEEAREQVLTRQFASQLGPKERRILLGLTGNLLKQGDFVHDVMQHLARNLKQFVQSREFLEQRKLNEALKRAQSVAYSLKEKISITEPLAYEFQLTSSELFSPSQLHLHDPRLELTKKEIKVAEIGAIGLEEIGMLVSHSEIDFRTLEANIQNLLEQYSQVSICGILNHYPATQGLASIVGYLILGIKNGIQVEGTEVVNWTGLDSVCRTARIPAIYFLKEHTDA